MISVITTFLARCGERSFVHAGQPAEHSHRAVTGLKLNTDRRIRAAISIADGLGANIAALTQSSQNAPTAWVFCRPRTARCRRSPTC